MRGPIDFIVVGFEGNKFNGSILKALGESVDSGVIGLVSLMVITKDAKGDVKTLNIDEVGDEYVVEFAQKYKVSGEQISEDDVDEVADLLENNTSAGILIIEQLWAKPLKKALIDAGGVLVSEGRIHPDAAVELSNKEDK